MVIILCRCYSKSKRNDRGLSISVCFDLAKHDKCQTAVGALVLWCWCLCCSETTGCSELTTFCVPRPSLSIWKLHNERAFPKYSNMVNLNIRIRWLQQNMMNDFGLYLILCHLKLTKSLPQQTRDLHLVVFSRYFRSCLLAKCWDEPTTHETGRPRPLICRTARS